MLSGTVASFAHIDLDRLTAELTYSWRRSVRKLMRAIALNSLQFRPPQMVRHMILVPF